MRIREACSEEIPLCANNKGGDQILIALTKLASGEHDRWNCKKSKWRALEMKDKVEAKVYSDYPREIQETVVQVIECKNCFIKRVDKGRTTAMRDLES